MSRRAPVGMLANLGGRLCDVCHGVLHGSAISALAAIFRVVICPEITGNAGKWRETVRKRRSVTRVIPLLPPQPGLASVSVPLKPGRIGVGVINHDCKHERGHGFAPLADP